MMMITMADHITPYLHFICCYSSVKGNATLHMVIHEMCCCLKLGKPEEGLRLNTEIYSEDFRLSTTAHKR